MIYLKGFSLPDQKTEDEYILSFRPDMSMTCYTDNAYPFKIFPRIKLSGITFSDITVFYGSNGAGKSTLLNVIASKLSVVRSSPGNVTHHFSNYLSMCSAETRTGNIPLGSRIITSDDVFDFLLNIRTINNGVDSRRSDIIAEYFKNKDTPAKFRDLRDYERLKVLNEAKRVTPSEYTNRRMGRNNISGRSNGESAYGYFTSEIEADALYLLDEPENSLAPSLQLELMKFIADSARFYNCQFVISTHSPFLLSLKGAKIYDLNSSPATVKKWTELENVLIYKRFFDEHAAEFKK